MIKKEKKFKDTVDGTIASFDCTKGNINGKITGFWDQSHPEMVNSRCMAASIVIGMSILHGTSIYTKG